VGGQRLDRILDAHQRADFSMLIDEHVTGDCIANDQIQIPCVPKDELCCRASGRRVNPHRLRFVARIGMDYVNARTLSLESRHGGVEQFDELLNNQSPIHDATHSMLLAGG
jgi:hypothetical protein